MMLGSIALGTSRDNVVKAIPAPSSMGDKVVHLLLAATLEAIGASVVPELKDEVPLFAGQGIFGRGVG